MPPVRMCTLPRLKSVIKIMWYVHPLRFHVSGFLMVAYIGATGHWQLRPLARYVQGLYLPIHQHRVRFIHHLWRWHRRTGSHSHRFSRVRGFLSATTGLQCVLLLILTHTGVDKDLLSLGTWFKCNDKWRHGLARCWPTSTFPDQRRPPG